MKRWRGQAGSNLVEMALVSPLLLLLVFGIVDFSLALFNKAVITNAAREGARAGMALRTPRLDPNRDRDGCHDLLPESPHHVWLRNSQRRGDEAGQTRRLETR